MEPSYKFCLLLRQDIENVFDHISLKISDTEIDKLVMQKVDWIKGQFTLSKAFSFETESQFQARIIVKALEFSYWSRKIGATLFDNGDISLSFPQQIPPSRYPSHEEAID